MEQDRLKTGLHEFFVQGPCDGRRASSKLREEVRHSGGKVRAMAWRVAVQSHGVVERIAQAHLIDALPPGPLAMEHGPGPLDFIESFV